MAQKAVVDAVKARQAAGWTTVPVFYPNDATTPPADGSAFVQVQFPIGIEERSALAHSYREEGAVRFIIHVPIRTGIGTGATYADELRALFRCVRFDGVETYTPGPPTDLGLDGAYYKLSVSVRYTYDFTA